ncbi:MAG: aromatic ring-hydroxylating dioxygenase subunit alpha [Rhodospirillaceae bacterium]|nr:MAG: aromatic ring-hydroxylating dioxygenase subunit alpha [Rhodospirillaceae bacterium]
MSNTALTMDPPRNYEDLLKRDTHPIDPVFRTAGEQDVGPLEVPTSWFLDRAIHEREIERIWKKSWQMACRLDEVAEVGDTYVYDIATLSIVIVRAAHDQIKAYYNSCLHRGRPLRDCPGNVSQLKCPFHGFTWSLDGALQGVPSRDQFPTINNKNFRLPEVQVALWGGFVFINPDLEAPPLSEYMGSLPKQFQRLPLDNRVKTVHVSAILKCNWKVAQDAFLEAFHVHTTHPQFLPAYSDKNHRLDVFGNYSRGVLGAYHPSDHMRVQPSAQDMFNAAVGAWEDLPPLAQIPDGTDLRPTVATMFREAARPTLGDDVDGVSDAEVVDIIWYTLFPNFNPFANIIQSLVYRFLPNGDDHTTSIMDVMGLEPAKPGERPKPVKERKLLPHESFINAPELGFASPVLSQDTANLEFIQKGIKNLKRGKFVLARHHELKLRHFYMLYARQMELPLD